MSLYLIDHFNKKFSKIEKIEKIDNLIVGYDFFLLKKYGYSHVSGCTYMLNIDFVGVNESYNYLRNGFVQELRDNKLNAIIK